LSFLNSPPRLIENRTWRGVLHKRCQQQHYFRSMVREPEFTHKASKSAKQRQFLKRHRRFVIDINRILPFSICDNRKTPEDPIPFPKAPRQSHGINP
jgi:hypothetical protein